MKEKLFDHGLFKEKLDRATNNAKGKEIAAAIGVNPATVSKWKNGTDGATPSINDLMNIAKAYGCSIDFLVGNEANIKKDLSVKDVCEMLLAIDLKYNLHIVPKEDEIREADPYDSGRYITDKEVSMSLQYSSMRGIYTEGEYCDLIIDFFKKYSELKAVSGLPEGTIETCTAKWLDEVESDQKFRKSLAGLADMPETSTVASDELPFS